MLPFWSEIRSEPLRCKVRQTFVRCPCKDSGRANSRFAGGTALSCGRLSDCLQPKDDLPAGRSTGSAAGARGFPRADLRALSDNQGDAAISGNVSYAQVVYFAKSDGVLKADIQIGSEDGRYKSNTTACRTQLEGRLCHHYT